MKKLSFKNIVDYIEKQAVEAINPPTNWHKPTGIVTAPTGGASPVTTNVHRENVVKPRADGHAIKNMQIAIQKIAKVISSTINYDALTKSLAPSTNVKGTFTNYDTNTPENKKQYQAQYGKDMFSNFMVNTYLRNSSVKGMEFDPNPKAAKMGDKNPSELHNMYTVLDSLRRIGQEKTEGIAEGVWGPRTNNALKNVHAIADSLMRLGHDLGMESKVFDSKKISELQNLIPDNENDISHDEKLERAPKITAIINGIIPLFNDFKEQVFMNPTYRAFIEGEPLFKISPKKESAPQLAGGEDVIYKDVSTNLDNSKYVKSGGAQFQLPNSSIQFNVADLLNAQNFNKWMATNKLNNMPVKDLLQKMLGVINTKLQES